MQEFRIHTWSCDCGYKQDFAPTQENLEKHFSHKPHFRKVPGRLLQDQCPSCFLRGNEGHLVKETKKEKKKKVVCFDSPQDLDEIRAMKKAEPRLRVTVGYENREETDEEFETRLDFVTQNLDHLSGEQKASFKERLKQETSKEVRKFPIQIEETDEERDVRIDKEMASYKILAAQEIKALRDKHEDKD